MRPPSVGGGRFYANNNSKTLQGQTAGCHDHLTIDEFERHMAGGEALDRLQSDVGSWATGGSRVQGRGVAFIAMQLGGRLGGL